MYANEIKIKTNGNIIVPDYPYAKMEDVPATTYKKMLSIPTTARTIDGLINAIRKYTDIFNDSTDDDLTELINSIWTDVCSDGVIIWSETR